MELIMQELLNAGIITMEQVERARMEKIMKARGIWNRNT